MDHTVSNLIRIKEEINSKNIKNDQNISTKIIAVSKTFSENKALRIQYSVAQKITKV